MKKCEENGCVIGMAAQQGVCGECGGHEGCSLVQINIFFTSAVFYPPKGVGIKEALQQTMKNKVTEMQELCGEEVELFNFCPVCGRKIEWPEELEKEVDR